MSQAERFRISTSLLHNSSQAWSNLGLWNTAGQDYESAAIELANRHWQLANPTPGARLLDAGCGYGASLDHWLRLDPTLKLTALECQPACLQQLTQKDLPVVEGRFDAPQLPTSIPAGSQDTLICLDAAYHAQSLLHFALFAAKALRPAGVLVFSTLVLTPEVKSKTRWLKTRWPKTRLLLRSAGIPLASQLSASQVQQVLFGAGFHSVELVDLDEEGLGVLRGFSDYANRRERELTLRQKASLEWLKISLTGWLCAHLSSQSQVRYMLIRAER